MQYIVYVDGACSNNGNLDAQASGSFAVYRLDKPSRISTELHDRLLMDKSICHESRFHIPANNDCRPTNNMAEASSLHTAIAWCLDNNVLIPGNDLHICMDSQLVLNQFAGLYKTNNRRLREIYTGIYAMLRRKSTKHDEDLEKCLHLHWIPGDVMKRSIIGH